jgi:NADH:ubiquinone oxidoreductase subunit K
MRGLGSSVLGTVVALFVLALAAGAVAVGWRWGNTRSPI